MRSAHGVFGAAAAILIAASGGARAQQSSADLAKAAQDPVAAMISVPFQNNTFFGIGRHDDTANVLNIRPVIPTTLGVRNIINRVIAPLVYLPDFTSGLDILPQGVARGSAFGLGDINYTAFFSPAKPGKLIWGIGPSIPVPTATSDRLGAQKWSIGPSAVVVIQPGPFVMGALARQLWSVAGSGSRQDVNQTLIQPFINYNLPNGWFLSSAPIIPLNWQASSNDRWLVPLGGVGKLPKVGPQPLQVSLQAYDNIERPTGGPSWSLRFDVSLLFPNE